METQKFRITRAKELDSISERARTLLGTLKNVILELPR